MMKKFFVLLATLISLNANAAVDGAMVKNAEKYLNSITGLTGPFVQPANGKQQNGVSSMLRITYAIYGSRCVFVR